MIGRLRGGEMVLAPPLYTARPTYLPSDFQAVALKLAPFGSDPFKEKIVKKEK
jgi:hypothetical protein